MYPTPPKELSAKHNVSADLNKLKSSSYRLRVELDLTRRMDDILRVLIESEEQLTALGWVNRLKLSHADAREYRSVLGKVNRCLQWYNRERDNCQEILTALANYRVNSDLYYKLVAVNDSNKLCSIFTGEEYEIGKEYSFEFPIPQPHFKPQRPKSASMVKKTDKNTEPANPHRQYMYKGDAYQMGTSPSRSRLMRRAAASPSKLGLQIRPVSRDLAQFNDKPQRPDHGLSDRDFAMLETARIAGGKQFDAIHNPHIEERYKGFHLEDPKIPKYRFSFEMQNPLGQCALESETNHSPNRVLVSSNGRRTPQQSFQKENLELSFGQHKSGDYGYYAALDAIEADELLAQEQARMNDLKMHRTQQTETHTIPQSFLQSLVPRSPQPQRVQMQPQVQTMHSNSRNGHLSPSSTTHRRKTNNNTSDDEAHQYIDHINYTTKVHEGSGFFMGENDALGASEMRNNLRQPKSKQLIVSYGRIPKSQLNSFGNEKSPSRPNTPLSSSFLSKKERVLGWPGYENDSPVRGGRKQKSIPGELTLEAALKMAKENATRRTNQAFSRKDAMLGKSFMDGRCKSGFFVYTTPEEALQGSAEIPKNAKLYKNRRVLLVVRCAGQYKIYPGNKVTFEKLLPVGVLLDTESSPPWR